MTTPHIIVDNVVKTYRTADQDVAAADGVSFTITSSATTAITGSSGSGKSTILQLMGGLDTPDSGAITVQGTDITTLTKKQAAHYRQGVGFVFQRFHLIPTLSVLDNVIVPSFGTRGERKKLRARAAELLDHVGLAGREKTLATRLSGGQQQRVAIVRALLNKPQLILADEPTGNLDSTTGKEIENLLFSLPKQHGTTVVIVTHDPTLATTCDHHIQMKDGKVVAA